jgi:hypothetical protein
MFRSSVVAFYAWFLHLYYRCARVSGRDRVIHLWPLRRVQSEVEEVIHRMAKILFTSEIAFRGLHRSMSQQELNLLQFPTAIMAQLRAGSPQIMRGNVLQPGLLATSADHVPDNVLRNAFAPHLAQSRDRSEDFAVTDPGGACPLVQS